MSEVMPRPDSRFIVVKDAVEKGDGYYTDIKPLRGTFVERGTGRLVSGIMYGDRVVTLYLPKDQSTVAKYLWAYMVVWSWKEFLEWVKRREEVLNRKIADVKEVWTVPAKSDREDVTLDEYTGSPYDILYGTEESPYDILEGV